MVLQKLDKNIPLTCCVLFSGIGCQERGIQNTGLFDLKVLCTSEIDKEALVSYAAIHCGLTNEMIEDYKNYPTKEEMAQYLTDLNIGYVPEKDKHYNWFRTNEKRIKRYWLASKLQNNLGDICRIKELPKADLWTSSFPCTDISVAGKMRGLEADSGTRSSLLWQTIRLLETAKQNNTLPKYILFENVKNLVGKKFIDSFNELISLLGDIGFNTYWQIINGKDCGIPQNRERVFIVCIRKDIDTGLFEFPKPFDNGVRLKDILEKNIPEKYYIKTQKAQDLIDELLKNGTISLENDDGGGKPCDLSVKKPRIREISNCISARTDRSISNLQQEGTGVVETYWIDETRV